MKLCHGLDYTRIVSAANSHKSFCVFFTAFSPLKEICKSSFANLFVRLVPFLCCLFTADRWNGQLHIFFWRGPRRKQARAQFLNPSLDNANRSQYDLVIKNVHWIFLKIMTVDSSILKSGTVFVVVSDFIRQWDNFSCYVKGDAHQQHTLNFIKA